MFSTTTNEKLCYLTHNFTQNSGFVSTFLKMFSAPLLMNVTIVEYYRIRFLWWFMYYAKNTFYCFASSFYWWGFLLLKEKSSRLFSKNPEMNFSNISLWLEKQPSLRQFGSMYRNNFVTGIASMSKSSSYLLFSLSSISHTFKFWSLSLSNNLNYSFTQKTDKYS